MTPDKPASHPRLLPPAPGWLLVIVCCAPVGPRLRLFIRRTLKLRLLVPLGAFATRAGLIRWFFGVIGRLDDRDVAGMEDRIPRRRPGRLSGERNQLSLAQPADVSRCLGVSALPALRGSLRGRLARLGCFLTAWRPFPVVNGGALAVSLDPVNGPTVDLARPGPENLKAGSYFQEAILP